eukprot:14390493-Alexandrium_andersonii.AAC.1
MLVSAVTHGLMSIGVAGFSSLLSLSKYCARRPSARLSSSALACSACCTSSSSFVTLATSRCAAA